jgi:hypothetical protein
MAVLPSCHYTVRRHLAIVAAALWRNGKGEAVASPLFNLRPAGSAAGRHFAGTAAMAPASVT